MGCLNRVQVVTRIARRPPLQSRHHSHSTPWYCGAALVACLVSSHTSSLAHEESNNSPGVEPEKAAPKESASAPVPPSFPEIEKLRARAVKDAPMDEALGGKTLHGTPVWPRTPECFPAESRDIFWEMDRVPDGPGGPLRSLNFDKNNNGKVEDVSPRAPHPDNERDAIRGRNTWILWAAGNEGFWNWLAQDGYGFTDLLVMIDSRTRNSRFRRLGVINQPGFLPNRSKRVLGLYLDLPAPDPNGPRMKPAPWDEGYHGVSAPPGHRDFKLFEPADVKEYQEARATLASMYDGVDPDIYGYPSGVVGLRLFLNPDFFANTHAAAVARKYWDDRVGSANSDRFYSDPSVTADPQLVRPFRVGMSCGFCHVGPHPLNPPKDREAPQWANLSSIIGDQYWKPQPIFANRLAPSSFLYHFLLSQQPGTIDTSLISTDQINNSNTINAVFEVSARLERARLNPSEIQSDANLRQSNIEDQLPALLDPTQIDQRQRSRHTAHVLLDGADSIGAFGALTRVYLNIGTFYEQWNRCHNSIIGFRSQRPFSVEVCQRNSVYWQVNEKYRAHYLAAFFTLIHKPAKSAAEVAKYNPPPAAQYHDATQAMHLKEAKDGDGETASRAATTVLQLDSPERRKAGRLAWLDHCAICHSSKQPDGFELSFRRNQQGENWAGTSAPKKANFVLPMDAKDWEDFKRSASYKKYRKLLRELVLRDGILDGDPLDDEHRFWQHNYLSTDIRVPITLVGTNPARALGTNAVSGHVWDSFSSETYKQLTPVGSLQYFDPVGRQAASFEAPGGGVGYYRPATHVSLWSTAPFLHNNTLGLYLDDPSVKGRLVQFLDAMRRMLWFKSRANKSLVLSDQERNWLETLQKEDTKSLPIALDRIVARPGDLRTSDPWLAAEDPGFIYRVPNDTYFEIPVAYTRALIDGIVGATQTSLAEWGFVIAVLVLLYLAWRVRVRYLGIWLVALAILLGSLLALSGLGGTPGTRIGVLLLGALDLLSFSSLMWWLLVLGLGAYGLILILVNPNNSSVVRWIVVLGAAAVVLSIGLMGGPALVGLVAALVVVAIIWRWNPTLGVFARVMFGLIALTAAIAGYVGHRFINGKTLLTVPGVNVAVGPFPVKLGPIPRGVPLNLMMNLDPDSPKFTEGVLGVASAISNIKRQHLDGRAAYEEFKQRAGGPLLAAAKCPDFVLDRGHLFGEALTEEEKESLIAFLKTL